MKKQGVAVTDEQALSQLQEAYLKSLRSNGTPQNVSSKLLRELQDDCLTISESELGESDSATICKFITTYSKLLRSRLKSIHLVRTDLSKVKRKKVRSKVDGKYVDLFREESVLTSDHGRLLKVILSLTAGCEILESFYILSVNFPTEWFETLGEALRACKSENFRIFGLKNVYMGDEGMKIITPFLSQSNFKVIHLENCGLTDRSTVYFVGLIKAQEALMDTLFWNCTLRLDTRRGDTIPSHDTLPFGLQALSLQGNSLTSECMVKLVRHLRRNQWLQAINFANNKIESDGIVHLAKALENNVTLHTLILSGNPGYSNEFGCTLDNTANAALMKMREMQEVGADYRFWEEISFPAPFDMFSVLKKWKNEKSNSRRKTSEAVEITSDHPVPHLNEIDPPHIEFRDLGIDPSDSEDLDLGSSCWNDQNNVVVDQEMKSDIDVDALEYAIPFLQSPDKVLQSNQNIDDFIRSDNEVKSAESRPPSRISLRSRKNNSDLSPSPSLDTPLQMYLAFQQDECVYDMDNKEDIERRRREGNAVERPRSAKNARTYAKSIEGVERPSSAPTPPVSVRSKAMEKRLRNELPVKRPSSAPSSSNKYLVRATEAATLKSKTLKDKGKGRSCKDQKPLSKSSSFDINNSYRKITQSFPSSQSKKSSPDPLVRRMNSTTSVPSILGRYVKSVHSKRTVDETATSIATDRNRQTAASGTIKTSPPVKIKDPKSDMSRTFGGLSGRNNPMGEGSNIMVKRKSSPKLKRRNTNKGSPSILTKDLHALATSVPISKFKSVYARKASTPRSPSKSPTSSAFISYRSDSKSPIDEALENLEENVTKRLNSAVSSVTANLEAVTRQLDGVANGHSNFVSIERSVSDREGLEQTSDAGALSGRRSKKIIDEYIEGEDIHGFDYYNDALSLQGDSTADGSPSDLPLDLSELIERILRRKLSHRVTTAASELLR